MKRYVFLFVLACLSVVYLSGVRINFTKSFPNIFFIRTSFNGVFEKGQYVSFVHSKSGVRCVKQVIGIPGDKLMCISKYFFVNGNKIGEVCKKSPRSGISLSPAQDREVPEGFLFVYAPHPESFDSRYEEFGLVRMEDIEERLCPIF